MVLFLISAALLMSYLIGGAILGTHALYPIEYLIKWTKSFFNNSKNFTMINTKVLLKAMSCLFLPSFAILALIFIGFLNWGKFTDFITSDSGWAVTIRLIMTIAEIVFLCIMYQHYLEKETVTDIKKKLSDGAFGEVTGSTDFQASLYGLFHRSPSGNQKLISYSTIHPDTYIVKIETKKPNNY